ncbi:MAG: hypothetical protein U1F15_07860 [Burkholderiales bacterium]
MERRRMGTLVAGFAIAAAWGIATAGTTTIYKCFDRNLGVLYTDQPCKGEPLEIRAGDPDPVAVAELAREREAVSRSAAQRIGDQRRAATERDVSVAMPYPYPEWYNGVYVPAFAGWYSPPPRDRRPDGDRTQRRERASTVPNPPPTRLRKEPLAAR